MNERSKLRQSFNRFCQKHSRILKETIDEPGGWRTLELLYGNDLDSLDGGTYQPHGLIDLMFYYSAAAKSTRSRYVEYKKIIRKFGK